MVLDSITSVVNLFVLAFVQNVWMLYIGGIVAFLDNTSTTMFRSLISKNVEADEIGKVFSVVGVFQALLPFASGPIFGYLYKSTVAYQPNSFLFLVIGILPCIHILIPNMQQPAPWETRVALEGMLLSLLAFPPPTDAVSFHG